MEALSRTRGRLRRGATRLWLISGWSLIDVCKLPMRADNLAIDSMRLWTRFQSAGRLWIVLPAWEGMKMYSSISIRHFIVGLAIWGTMTAQASVAKETIADPALPATPPRSVAPAEPVSPQIGEDGRVTFRAYAPNAHKVELAGNLENDAVRDFDGAEPLVEFTMQNGVWTGTTRVPIQPGAFRYLFRIDGALSTDVGNTNVAPTASRLNSLLVVPGDFSEQRTVPHGTLSKVTYTASQYGPGTQRSVYVHTPPGYEQGGERYPVLYLLHGYTDTASSWSTVGRADMIMDNLYADNEALPMIVVMLSGWTPGRNQVYALDARKDPFNEELIETIIPMIDRKFRTVATREGRALSGLSAGGAQTLAIGLGNLDTFAWVLPLSTGWFEPEHDTIFLQINAEAIASADERLKLFWWGWGDEDIAKENGLRSMASLESAGLTRITKFQTPGGHDWSAWRKMLHEFAPLLFR